ncbi:MAG TPA: prepilin peptidase [Longimicrobiales bacterium]|nr:prepilin peptidase [Longimicrobiales bacterium]
MMPWADFWLVALVAAAALSDLKDRTIPNYLTVTGFGIGVMLSLSPGGISPQGALLGGAVGFGLSLPLFALGAFGGGDAKLITAVGAFMGPVGILEALLFTALIGGAMAVYTTWRLGLLRQTISNTGALVLNLVTVGRFGHRQTLRSEGAITIPYGVAIAVGSLIARFAL